MASLSEKLRRERELRGISLKQISDDTKIGVRFLEALEEDRLDRIPGEFYRRSYLRAYARYLGLDEDRAVNAYTFSNQEKPADEEPSKPPDIAVATWVPRLAVVAVVVLLGLLLVRMQPAEAPTPAVSSAEATGAATAAPVTPESGASEHREPPNTSETPAPAVPMLAPIRDAGRPQGSLRFVVAVGESCWLEIQADGEVVTTGLKEEGFRHEFVALEEVRLWLGNAGGVSLWVNDEPLRSLGRPGQVRKDLSITPENFMNFVRSNRGSS